MQVLFPDQKLPNSLSESVGSKLKIDDEIQNLLQVANIGGAASVTNEGSNIEVDYKIRQDTVNTDDNNNNREESDLSGRAAVESLSNGMKTKKFISSES